MYKLLSDKCPEENTPWEGGMHRMGRGKQQQPWLPSGSEQHHVPHPTMQPWLVGQLLPALTLVWGASSYWLVQSLHL